MGNILNLVSSHSNSNGEALQSGWSRTDSSFIIIEIQKNPKKLANL